MSCEPMLTMCVAGTMLEVVAFIGIVATAFVMGLGLMGALWCIYNHTGTSCSLAAPQTNALSQQKCIAGSGFLAHNPKCVL